MISQLIRYDMNCQLGRCNKRWPQQHLPIDTTLLLILFAFKCTANNKPTEYNHETIILICIIAYLPLLSYASLCQPWNFPTPPQPTETIISLPQPEFVSSPISPNPKTFGRARCPGTMGRTDGRMACPPTRVEAKRTRWVGKLLCV